MSALLDALALPQSIKLICVELVRHLLCLGTGARVGETFLVARCQVIRRYIRTIPFVCYVGLYVHDLAVVTCWIRGERERSSDSSERARASRSLFAFAFNESDEELAARASSAIQSYGEGAVLLYTIISPS